MSRLLAVATACLVFCVCAASAEADAIDTNVRQLDGSSNYKVRLAAALSLAKSRDARAVIALSTTLRNDGEESVRRVAALALEKMIDINTPEDARDLGLGALEHAAANDADQRVRQTAGRAAKALSGLRKKRSKSSMPAVFVNVDATTDQSKQLPSDAGDRLTKLLRRSVESTGFATSWPGGLPTSAELTSNRSRGFILAGTVKKVEITRMGGKTQIACTVAVRVAPWMGKDGGERWEANRAASASGTAKAMTGNRERDVESGLRDCIEAVAEDVTARQVLPFLKQVASAKP
jgi:hypothetical protein